MIVLVYMTQEGIPNLEKENLKSKGFKINTAK